MSILFNGTSSKLENATADIFNGSAEFTVVAWTYANGTGEGGFGRILSASETGDAVIISHTSVANEARLRHEFSTTQGGWSYTLTDNQWNALALSYNRSSVSNDPTVRVNFASAGIAESSTPVGTAVTPNPGYCVGNSVSQTVTWNGRIQHFQFFNVILTAAEMDAALRRPGSVRRGLRLWLPMFHAGWISDISGNNFHGTGNTLATADGAPTQAPWVGSPGYMGNIRSIGVGDTYYVSTTGSDTNNGLSEGSPFATIQKAHDVAIAGDTILVRGGTYSISTQILLTRDGASGNRISLFNYPGELPVIDATGISGLGNWTIELASANWWHIKGLELKNNSGYGGLGMEGSCSDNIVEMCNSHHNNQTGIAIYGTGSNNLLLNNDCHHNYDPLTDGENSDGIAQNSTGTGNVVRGNRCFFNSDDGIEVFHGAPTIVDNNWCWRNGYNDALDPLGGDGNGIKLGGGTPPSGGHTVTNNISFKNRVIGFRENSATVASTLYNNTAWDNGSHGFDMPALAHVMRNNLSHDSVNIGAPADDTFNSWNLAVTVTDADFVSIDFSAFPTARNGDGSLPTTTFLHLASGSDLINVGTDVGLPFNGAAPDLGAFEFVATATSVPVMMHSYRLRRAA